MKKNPDIDYGKSVLNIKAKVNSTATQGRWTAYCEHKDCSEMVDSSKFHGWNHEGWILCPKHSGTAESANQRS